jgi:MerR family transcriptional regulator/heat shock protein HspR
MPPEREPLVEGRRQKAEGRVQETEPAARSPQPAADENDRPRYVISVAAQILHVHPQTLRLYEREGLVEPKRTGGKIRLYSERDLEQIRRITRLTNDLGVNLAGAEIIISMRERMIEMRGEMERLRRRMDAEIEELRRELEDGWRVTSDE